MIRYIAFYLPQYHPIPENDNWWGKGFTEWRNVVTATPKFKGHYQPHIPADLGFYDLRLDVIRKQQADMARDFGVYGFCYYHYWFDGRRLLGKPLDDVLNSGQPDFPFCICWANENWTRVWDGRQDDVLIEQRYSKSSNLQHIELLSKIFSDNRYIKVDGKPLFLIYRPFDIPDLDAFLSNLRDSICALGFPGVYVCGMKTNFSKNKNIENVTSLLDALIDFQPNKNDFPTANDPISFLYTQLEKILSNKIYQWLKRNVSAIKKVQYDRYVKQKIGKLWFKNKTFPVVFPSWDNSARRKSAIVIQNNDASLYEEWLKYSMDVVSSYPEAEQFVFINAWNEWAEGCHLEPDLKNGFAFLEATKRASLDKL